MGACYDVNLKIQFKDKESEDAAIHAMQNFIAEHDGSGINFSLSAYKKEGTTPDTLDGLLKIFLAGWNMCHPEIKHGRKWFCCQLRLEVCDDENVCVNSSLSCR